MPAIYCDQMYLTRLEKIISDFIAYDAVRGELTFKRQSKKKIYSI